MRQTTASDTENRLDLFQRIVKPRTVGDMASPENLEVLKAELLAGTGGRLNGKAQRSPHTVNGYMRTLVAALNWGHEQGWLPSHVSEQTVPADDPEKAKPPARTTFGDYLRNGWRTLESLQETYKRR